MIGILLVTHGHLSEALLEASAMLVANQSMARAVTFLPGEGVEDLENAVRQALQELAGSQGILAFADIPGGSPARIVGSFMVEQDELELITGVNLPMLVESLIMRESMPLSDLVKHVMSSGNEGIISVRGILELNNG